jgi:hypothetical protein
MTSRMERAQPATRGSFGMRRLRAIAVPITCHGVSTYLMLSRDAE